MHSTRSFDRTVTLSEVVAAFLEGRATTAEVIKVFYTDRITIGVIANTCRKVGLDDAIEDIRQEIGLLLANKLLKEIVHPDAIYGVIKKSTQYKCIDLIRMRVARPQQSLDEMLEPFLASGDGSSLKELEDHSPVFQPESIIFSLDQRKAIDMFNSRLQQARISPLDCAPAIPDNLHKIAKRSKAAPKSAATELQNKHDSEADALIKIRDILGVQNEQFAVLLGITEPMLCFYLYNSRRRIPAALMDEANSILGQMDEERHEAVKYLSSTSVEKVIEGWMVAIGVDPASRSANEDFGKAMSYDRSTVWRWRTGKHTPKMSVLVRTHLAIQDLVKAAAPQ